MHHRSMNLRNGRSKNCHTSAAVFVTVSEPATADCTDAGTIGAGVGATTIDLIVGREGA